MKVKTFSHWKIHCLEYGQTYTSAFDITYVKSQLQENSK